MTVNESDFPRLRESGYELTSDADEANNCIAWAAGDSQRWWEPIEGRYWPEGADRLYTVQALVQAYSGDTYGQVLKFMSRVYPQEAVPGDE